MLTSMTTFALLSNSKAPATVAPTIMTTPTPASARGRLGGSQATTRTRITRLCILLVDAIGVLATPCHVGVCDARPPTRSWARPRSTPRSCRRARGRGVGARLGRGDREEDSRLLWPNARDPGGLLQIAGRARRRWLRV
jgi:hypothetical protein